LQFGEPVSAKVSGIS